MRNLGILSLALLLSAGPGLAQQEPEAGEGDAPGLMQRGAELFFEGLRQEMSPAMRDLRDLAEQFGPAMQEFATEMGPALADLMDKVDDWARYHPPEMLPNGDIIMRRKADPDALPEDTPSEDTPPEGPTDI